MSIDDSVKVYSGNYTGYYGMVKEIGQGVVRVTHREDFYGFWIDEPDLIPPPVEVLSDE